MSLGIEMKEKELRVRDREIGGMGKNTEHTGVPGFLASRPNWVPPSPHPQANVAPPLWVQGGRHTRLLGIGWGTTGTHVYCTILVIPIRGRS